MRPFTPSSFFLATILRSMPHKLCVVGCIVLLLMPSVTFARHQSSRINRDKLDDDPVKTFPVPVLFSVTAATLIGDFGDPRGDGTRSHEGQDMLAPQSTPIVSPTEAIVIRTGSGDSSGKYVYTANPGGETFRYMHLDSIADLDPGDELKVGDFIGTVGDTGNAPDGVYHLHFEVRDERNQATDPLPRLDDTLTLKDKISFLDGVFDDISNDAQYAEFLLDTFPSEIKAAVVAKYELPRALQKAVEASPLGSTLALQERLQQVIGMIPGVLPTGLSNGDQGTAVSLLQTYLIFKSSGPAQVNLRLAGATGYFGGVTEAAIVEYQTQHKLPETGSFDAATKAAMQKAP